MIAVFAYAFAHRKTHDFLVEIALAGHRDVAVIAAPAEPLPAIDRTRYFNRTLSPAPARETKEICEALGFEYHEIPHRQVDEIVALVREKSLRLGIISGARILKRGIIEAFEQGIVNFHPGAIPQTSGLDAFFYTIKTGADAGVTTHFIDPRVDAGDFLYFDAVQISPDDTPETVQDKGYDLQIVSLRRFLSDWEDGRLQPSPIDRPTKNQPMSPEEKWATLLEFSSWRAVRLQVQAAARLHEACRTGNVDMVRGIISRADSGILEARTAEGWTPLILACHAQHVELAEFLLEHGANPNATGARGTTVLMYAKTPLMAEDNPDVSLLDMLIAKGADPGRCDMFGKPIQEYVKDHASLTAYFKKTGA